MTTFLLSSARSSFRATTARAATSAIMVWEFRCLKDIHGDKGTRLVAPLKDDGTPDMSRVKLEGVRVTYDPACGHIEVTK